MNRRLRIAAALLAIASLVFAQLAVSAYVCPMVADDVAVEEHEADCAGKPAANLCESHCMYGKASLELPKPASSPAFVAGPPLRVQAVEPGPMITTAVERLFADGKPPPLSRFTVLRI